jgi:hypothetical protein
MFTTSVGAGDTLEMRVPGPGYVVLRATGNFVVSRSVGSSGWIVANIDTLSGVTDWDAWAWYNFDSELPTGTYVTPYTVTRVVPVGSAGLYSFYVNGQTSGLSTGYIEECYFVAEYFPTHLGTEVPHPPASSSAGALKGPEAILNNK